MAYSDFTKERLEKEFSINFKRNQLFNEVLPVQPSETLTSFLEISRQFPLYTEKAKSEAIIFPIMTDLKKNNMTLISIFSGERMEAQAEKGLTGECDYIITGDPELLSVQAPIISIIEAKKDSADVGLAKCTAQLIGARTIHEQHGKNIVIYGCITNSEDWQFIKLENSTLYVDTRRYYIVELPMILGVFQRIIDEYYKVI